MTTRQRIGLRPSDLAVHDPSGAGLKIAGWRCENGDSQTLTQAFRCPFCYGEMRATLFAPLGRVWSHTRILVPSPDREPPYTLAYVDLDDGPRLLCDIPAVGGPVRIGDRVRVFVQGDHLAAEAIESGSAT